jgi:hypothetical protein
MPATAFCADIWLKNRLFKTFFTVFYYTDYSYKPNISAMKKIHLPLILSLLMCLSSCDAIEGIFKAGVWVGVIAVVVVILLIIWLFSAFRK